MTPSTSNIVLVTGATGTTGSALLRLLEAKGVAVRAMLRREGDASRLGPTTAAPVVADFDDADSLRAALSGVQSAYLVTPSSLEAEARADPLRGGGRRGRRRAPRQALAIRGRQSRPPSDSSVTTLRSSGGFVTSGSPTPSSGRTCSSKGSSPSERRSRRRGSSSPIGDARVGAVDVRDIAAVAAAALTEPGHLGQAYAITGPEAISLHDVARAISVAIGREVRFVDVPPEAFAAALRGCGYPLGRRTASSRTARTIREVRRRKSLRPSATSRARGHGTSPGSPATTLGLSAPNKMGAQTRSTSGLPTAVRIRPRHRSAPDDSGHAVTQFRASLTPGDTGATRRV